MALFGEKRRRLLGLDIGSASIKILELARSGSGYRVESHAVQPLSPNAVVERNISSVEEVGEAIRQAHSGSRSRIRRAALAVGGAGVIARTVAMEASLSDAAIAARIDAEANRYIPHPRDEVALDFEVRGLSEQQAEQADVLLVACRRNYIESLTAALTAGNLKAAVIEPESQAIERLFALLAPRFRPQAGELVVALADLGATVTTLSVLVDGRCVFAREQPFGGGQLTEAIQRHYSLSREEAELAKRQKSLPGDYAQEVLQPFAETAAQQLSRSLRFFFSSTHYSGVDHLLLLGGAAGADGLAETLQRALETPATVADPFADMSLAPGVDHAALAADAPALALACGLAMRSFEGLPPVSGHGYPRSEPDASARAAAADERDQARATGRMVPAGRSKAPGRRRSNPSGKARRWPWNRPASRGG